MRRKCVKLLTAAAITACLLTGCGGAAQNSSQSMMADTAAPAENSSAASERYGGGVASENYAVTEEAAVDTAMDAQNDGGATAGEAQDDTPDSDGVILLEEKLVYYCDLQIETLDYPATMTAIKEAITQYGGVIQSESESDSGYNWYYENYRKTSGTMNNYLQVRIPSKDYNNFLAELDGVGKIVSKSTSVDNISQKYYDTTAQIEALQIQEKNLLAMLEKCETIEDMITVEQRLSEVQYQLNNLQTSRRYMDMDVAYSYVNINISEVMEYRQDSEPVRRNTFADRLRNTLVSTGRGFLSFLEGLLFLLIRLSPYIVIIVLFCLFFPKEKIKQYAEDRRIKKTAKYARGASGRQNRTQQSSMPQGQNADWPVTPPVMPQNQGTGWPVPPAQQSQNTDWPVPAAPQNQNTDWLVPPTDQIPQAVQRPDQNAHQSEPEETQTTQNPRETQ